MAGSMAKIFCYSIAHYNNARGGEDGLSHFWEGEAPLSGITNPGRTGRGNLISLFAYFC